MEWQDINTAPKDGTTVLIYATEIRLKNIYGIGYYIEKLPFNVLVGRYVDYYWDTISVESYFSTSVLGVQPTHWMPLPNPPEGDLKNEWTYMLGK
jgi:hypothetical protein